MKQRQSEQGNIFFFILLGIVLFGALMFVFSRSARQEGGNVGGRQLQVQATDLVSYAQTMGQAVDRTMLHDISETQLSFDNSFMSGTYANANCAAAKCAVFDPAGGATGWQSPPSGINDGSNWIITGANAVPDVGDDTAADLVLLLSGLKESLCIKINDSLGVTNPAGVPPTSAGGIDTTPFTGTFTNSKRLGVSGVRSGCVNDTAGGAYVFYSVLMER